MSPDLLEATAATVTSAQAAGPSKEPPSGLRRHGDETTRLCALDDCNVIVLLVDDQVMIGEAVRRALADELNLVFHFCSESSAALEAAQQIRPTVILQDLVMPGVDGLALVRQYRAHEATRNTPIIVLSAREEPRTKKEAFAGGANDYVVKLPDKVELIARIRYHSQAYLSAQQRDAAYRALHESQRQLLAANIELQRLSNMDGLTGLNNRRRFDEYASAEWLRARRDQMSLALLLADVDHFKLYNDTHGHLAGDAALKRIGGAIYAACGRPADLPARYGGDEFVVVLPGAGTDALNVVGERMRQAVDDLNIENESASSGVHLTLSIGGAVTMPTESSELLDLIAIADKNLYEAKALGRNRVVTREKTLGTHILG
jgi:two-component system, chemotaxis family, response regulator WspR